MIDKQQQSNNLLVGQNALSEDLNQHWEQDNQAWWDWYVTLADNTDQQDHGELLQLSRWIILVFS